MRIGVFCNLGGVAEPFRDFEEAFPVLHEQAGEGVPHNVGRDPGDALFFHVFGEGFREIVAVNAPALPDVGPEHEGLAQPVFFEEAVECSAHGDGAPAFFVIEAKGGGVVQIDLRHVHEKPGRDGLHDLVLAQAGVESDHEDETQVFPGAIGDEFVPEFAIAEADARTVRRIDGTDGDGGIMAKLFLLHAPAEEGADSHDEFVRGRDAGGGEDFVVLRLEEGGINHLERGGARHGENPAAQERELVVPGRARILAALHLLLQMLLHLGQQMRAGVKQRQLPNGGGFGYRFLAFAGLQGNHGRADAIYLRWLEVIGLPAEKDAAHGVVTCSSHVQHIEGTRSGRQGISKGQRIRGSNPCTGLERATSCPSICSTFVAARGLA